jgi:hypothetical protein
MGTSETQEFIAKILDEEKAKRKKTRELLGELKFSNGSDQKANDKEFVPSSFLYIRSIASDAGLRPLPNNTVFWISPDISIRPLSGVGSPTQTLQAGVAYQVEINLRNRGDVPVPNANVEIFLCDPTIGFDTRFARKLGVGATWVPGIGSGSVRIPVVVPASEAGHKCMFARVYSFSPLDIPNHDTSLNPFHDRHVAQLNLNIVNVGAIVQFNIVHQANFQGQIQLEPALLQEIVSAGQERLARKRFKGLEEKPAEMLSRMGMTLTVNGKSKVVLESTRAGLQISSKGEGPSLERQRDFSERRRRVYAAASAGRETREELLKIHSMQRKLDLSQVQSSFQLIVPKLQNQDESVTAFHLSARDSFGDVVGGFTLLVDD